MGHSPKSPSGFHIIKSCPGALRMQRGIPDKENPAAALGTAAHALGEKCLLDGGEPHDYIGQKFGEFKHSNGRIEEFIVDGEMADNVKIYVDYCREIASNATNVRIEQKLELPFLGKDESGTADHIALTGNILHVTDYKNGIGYVDEVENTQGLCYGMGAANLYEDEGWDTLRITIVQPRAYGQKAIRSWDVSRTDLMDYKLEFVTASMAADEENAPLKAGNHCTWCKARFGCRAYNNQIQEDTGMDFESPNSEPVNPDMLDDEQIIDIVFNKIPQIKKWASAMEDYAQQRAEEKNPLPGSKLVNTRATRKWKDQARAESFFGNLEGAYNRTFKTAPQMEKLLGKREFSKYEEEYVEKTSTGVTLVPDSDPRPSARPVGSDEFGAVQIDNKPAGTPVGKYDNVNLFG